MTKISAPDSLPKNVVSNISRCGPPGNFPNMCPPPSLTYLVSLISLLELELAELTKWIFCSDSLLFILLCLNLVWAIKNQGLFIRIKFMKGFLDNRNVIDFDFYLFVDHHCWNSFWHWMIRIKFLVSSYHWLINTTKLFLLSENSVWNETIYSMFIFYIIELNKYFSLKLDVVIPSRWFWNWRSSLQSSA